MKDLEGLNRWRLVLGKYSEESINSDGFSYQEMDELLDFLYSREYSEEGGVRDMGGRGESTLTIPNWISKVKDIFPREAVEILERHALDKYNLTELLGDKEVLERLEPNMDLLKSIIQMKGYIKGPALDAAKNIVRKVSDEIKKKLERHIRQSIVGKLDRLNRGNIRSARNLDFKRTIAKNLKNYDIKEKRLLVDRIYFNRRTKSYNKWHIILLVDESGSMVDSVIYSAVMAGIFSNINALKTNLVVFDTNVVDLSDKIDDAVDVLMGVQLGGGTHIAKALAYGKELILNPNRTIVILVSDLYEGYGVSNMYKQAKDIIDTGAKLIVLPALNIEGKGVYDKRAGQVMADLGAEVAMITPKRLGQWIGKVIS